MTQKCRSRPQKWLFHCIFGPLYFDRRSRSNPIFSKSSPKRCINRAKMNKNDEKCRLKPAYCKVQFGLKLVKFSFFGPENLDFQPKNQYFFKFFVFFCDGSQVLPAGLGILPRVEPLPLAPLFYIHKNRLF